MHHNNRDNARVIEVMSVLRECESNDNNNNSSNVRVGVDGDETASRTQGLERNTKTRRDDSHHVSLSSIDWIALCMVISMMVVAWILFILSVASSSVFSTINHQQDKGVNNGRGGGNNNSALPLRANNDDSLYKCELSYLQMDSSLIKFSIDHLIVVDEDGLDARFGLSNPSARKVAYQDGRAAPSPEQSKVTFEGEPFRFDPIDYNATTMDELMASTTLDPKLPFIFFINGFNTLNEYGEISGTWMFDVAKNLALDSLKRAKLEAADKSDKQLQVTGPGDEQQGEPMLLSRLFSRLLARLNWPREVEKRPMRRSRSRGRGRGRGRSNMRANVIFLTWSIPDIFADNVLAMIPAYYKTVANYELIVGFVAEAIKKSVRFVERSRSLTTTGATTSATKGLNGWSSQEERSQYYLGFEFYGHSLGSHILSDAIRHVRLTLGLGAKFGKLTGLDPATPCFLSLEHGISIAKVSSSVRELVVVHSNAGLAGLTSERADVEIVLNGGTFQPGCPWYDFACHHSRSTGILRYRDDECQMVAYKCTSYHHFKNGACETCDQTASPWTYDLFKRRSSDGGRGDGGTSHQPGRIHNYTARASDDSSNNNDAAGQGQAAPVQNCVLVNLPEQHLDSERVLEFAEYNNRIRQLADDVEDAERARRRSMANSGRRRHESIRMKQGRQSAGGAGRANLRRLDEERTKKAYYHYVNTSPNFRSGRKSHCQQHYQLRLIMYHKDGDDKRIEQRCRPSGHLLESADSEIRLALLYETDPMLKMAPPVAAATTSGSSGCAGDAADKTNKINGGTRRQLLLLDNTDEATISEANSEMGQSDRRQQVSSNTIGLGAIIKDMLHTALLTIEREPKLFVGALVDNIDLGKLIDCYVRENATSGPHFVLDVAFMSHTNQKVRHAYSSVLCGQLELNKKPDELGANKAAAAATTGHGQISTHDSANSTKTSNSDSATDEQFQLVLNLCKQSELTDVSAQIDKLLNHIELHRLDDTWKVSLLNNLFSLFTEWEPF